MLQLHPVHPWRVSLVRDTRIDLPFATGGTLLNVAGEFNGGLAGRHRRLPEVRLRRAVGTRRWGPGRQPGQLGSGVQFVLALTAKLGFHLRRRRPVLHRALLDGRHAVRHSAARLSTSSRSRPTGSTRWPAAAPRPAPTPSASRAAAFTRRAGRTRQPVRSTSTSSSTPATSTGRSRSSIRAGCSAAPASGWR